MPAESSRVATVEDLFDRPQHPYTRGLFRSVPRLGTERIAAGNDSRHGAQSRPVSRPDASSIRAARDAASWPIGAGRSDGRAVTAAGETFRVTTARAMTDEPLPRQSVAAALGGMPSDAEYPMPATGDGASRRD